jgi:hypothetical protein
MEERHDGLARRVVDWGGRPPCEDNWLFRDLFEPGVYHSDINFGADGGCARPGEADLRLK